MSSPFPKGVSDGATGPTPPPGPPGPLDAPTPASLPPPFLSSLPPPPEPARPGVFWRLGGVVKTLRPHQWFKNTFVLAPVFFAKDIFRVELLVRAASAFAVFCLLAGAVYTMNDLVDVEGDRTHPVKRRRPIPSGRVPIPLAKAVAAGLVVASLAGGVALGPGFAAAAFGYFGLNVAYSLRLKKIAYLDVMCIAAGFVLRVVAGGLATSVKVSDYLLVCTALLALFLGFGKRRHELAQALAGSAAKQRAALEAYSPAALTAALALTCAATLGVYTLYTLDPDTQAFFQSRLLWPTVVFPVVGMGRFLYLVTHRPRAESPTQEMLRDVPFILNLVAWVLAVLWLLYQLKPGVG
ncbi:MAG TPA: decaprenyl-phosphate phosphoribosyltransferase [Polyangiaceae bacterium]|nr:decaprenyl-phosphate phosphoribosyltransferase [Polyangiaceae bacterium]